MSVCIFLAANYPLPDVSPEKEYPLHINIDTGEIYDGDADDNFFLHAFQDVKYYTDKKHGVELEWAYCTEGRVERIRKYVEKILEHTESVEIWRVWLRDYYEYDERPIITKKKFSLKELGVKEMEVLEATKIWRDDNPERPHFTCLEIVR